MTLPTRIELLQRMPIFGALAEPALRLLLARARERDVAAGDSFFREGNEASSMFVLERGSATVFKGWQGGSVVLHTLAAGDCFGEMALMDLCPRSATVRADEDCHALEIAATDLYELFEHDVEQFALLQMNLGREVCRRLRAADEQLFRARMAAAGDTQPGPLASAADRRLPRLQ
jgi:CRP/FNR family transcriptional regulator, cyclic AMP receptor protein